MFEVLIALLSFLILFLAVAASLQKRQQKDLERKTAIANAHSQSIDYIEDTLDELKDVPVSTKTIAILLNRVHSCAEKMCELFPQNREYALAKEKAKIRIEELDLIESKRSLPKATNEKHMLLMLRALKKTISLLNQEVKRDKKAFDFISINKEISMSEFFIAYLTSNHYISLAEKAMTSKIYGTARDRYESALKTLDAAPQELGRKWREKKRELCNERLEIISEHMQSSNRDFVQQKNNKQPDETGLSRMMDHKKRKIAIQN